VQLSSPLLELDAFGGDFDVMWRGFVTSVIAAVALQYVDPFRTSKLVLFQVRFNSFRPYAASLLTTNMRR
jgi:hypothetical protein